MKRKKMRLSLGKLTVASLDFDDQSKVQGGAITNWCTAVSACCTVGSLCCTINVATCLPPDGCNPTDTYQPGGTACP